MSLEAILNSRPVADWQTRRAIVLDWYDGPREGVCALSAPECEFFFALLAERANEDDLDDRLFRLAAVPIGTVDQLFEALGGVGEKTDPVWTPVWRFPDEAQRRQAEQLVSTIESHRQPTNIVIATRDMRQFQGCWVQQPSVEPIADWFAHLGLTHPVAN